MIIRRKHTAKDFPPRKAGVCWLYILTAGEAPIVKIGIAVDLRARLSAVARKYDRAYDIHLRGAYALPSEGLVTAAEIERRAHRKLYRHRIGGSADWFFVDPDLAEDVVLDCMGRPENLRRFPKGRE